MIKRALLMAAGLGTRLRPFTETQPKAFLPLMGVPMAQFAMDSLVAAGVEHAVVNIHHLPERSRAGVAALESPGVRVTVSDESRELLGSAGGPRRALELLGNEPFFMVNADVVSDVDLRALAAHHARLRERFGVRMTLAVFERVENDALYPEIHFDPATSLMTRRGEHARGRPVFVGAAVYEPEAVAHIPLDTPAEFIPAILNPALAANGVGVFLTRGMWYDVGSPELWLQAHLSLIRRMETGDLSIGVRKRIEANSRRLGPGIWSSAAAHVSTREGWAAPAFWGDGQASEPPALLGPSQVIYGQDPCSELRQPNSKSRSAGIGYGGVFVSCGNS